MLAGLLRAERCDLAVASHALLASEVLELVEEQGARIVCIAALPPGGAAHARLLCRRLRTRFPDLKILVGRWGLARRRPEAGGALLAAGADAVATTLAESREQIAALVPIVSHRSASSTPAITREAVGAASPATAPAA